MKPESRIYNEIVKYLTNLGYPAESLYPTDSLPGQSVNMEVKRQGRVLIVIHIENVSFLTKSIPIEQVGFHPVTRKLQGEAERVGASYYLVSNGKEHLWLKTQENGRPGLEKEIDFGGFSAKSQNTPYLINAAIDYLHASVKEQPLSGDSLFDLSLVLYNRILQEKRGQFDYLIDLVPIFGSNYNLQRKELDEKLQHLLQFLSGKNISLLSNRDNVLNYIDKLFLNYRKEWYVPRWLADLMVKLLPDLQEMEIIDLFGRNGTIASTAQLNGYKQVYSFCSNQNDLYWLRLQQLLTTDSPEPPEIIFNPDIQSLVEQTFYNYQPKAFLLAPMFEMKVTSNYMGMRKGISVILERALDAVSFNGYVICIIPDSFLFSAQDKTIRDHLAPYVRGIISLPIDTFRPFSLVKTSLLVLKKQRWGDERDEVLMSSLEKIPEQNIFESTGQSDITEIVSCLKALENKQQFPKTDTSFTVQRLQADNFQIFNYQEKQFENIDEEFTLIPLEKLLTSIKRGSTIKQDKEGGIPFISPAVIRAFELREDSILSTSVSGLGKTPRRTKAGEILFNIIGTYCGNAALVTEEYDDMPINAHVIALTPNPAIIHTGYLVIALNSKIVQDQLNQLQAGSVISALGLKKIYEVKIPVTAMERQKAIYDQYTSHAAQIASAKLRLSLLEEKLSASLTDFALRKEARK